MVENSHFKNKITNEFLCCENAINQVNQMIQPLIYLQDKTNFMLNKIFIHQFNRNNAITATGKKKTQNKNFTSF